MTACESDSFSRSVDGDAAEAASGYAGRWELHGRASDVWTDGGEVEESRGR